MAYVPPHKRQSKDVIRASPIPETLQPQFQRNMNLRASTSHKNKCGKIVYADHAIYKWFALGLDDDGHFPPNIHLEPISNEYLERKTGEKPLVLVNSIITEEGCKLERNCSKSPWEIIAENVHQELVSSFEILRKEIDDQGSEKVKLALIARLGKIVFRGNPYMRLQSVNKIKVEETILRQLNRSLSTNIPSSYMENIIDGVVPTIGVEFEEEKDVYIVKLSDNTRPEAPVLCKCIVLENKKLRLYKVELSQVHHMVIDVSCLDKNLDLKLILRSRSILTALTDDEMNSLRDLISSAVVDSDMKGGLRWPLGKTSSGGRYRVVVVWHIVTKAYTSSSFRLKARDADRYDFRTGTRETTTQIYLKLNRIVSEIQEPGAESDSISKMLEDSLRLIWDKFLSCERFLT
ncbi:bidirectional sugar transporter NEC [Salix suchowensis]|nr:bidirectional sugar transporter NEC [Salix suchowensis]